MANIFTADPTQSIWDDPADPPRTSSPLLDDPPSATLATASSTSQLTNDNVTATWGANRLDAGLRDINNSIWDEQLVNQNILSSNETLSALNGNPNNNVNSHTNSKNNSNFNIWVDSIRAEFTPLGPDSVLITEIPEKEGLLFKHTNYLVEHHGSFFDAGDDDLDNNFNNGSGGKVVRRYSDFFWLSETLLKKYPFRLIPELPPKSVGYSKSDTQFMEKRLTGLRRFINQIVRHPVLGRDELVVMFLTVPTDLANWRKNANYNQNEEFLNQTIDDAFLAQWDEVYMERWRGVQEALVKAFELWRNMTILIERFEKRLEMYQKDEELFARSISKFSQCMPGIYSFDNTTTAHEITDGLTSVVKGYTESQRLIGDKRRSYNTEIHTDFKKFGDYLFSLMSLIERHKRIGGNQIPALNLKCQQLRDKLKSYQGKAEVKGYEVDNVKDEITRVQKEIEAQANRDWLIKKVILHEFILFQETMFLISETVKKLIQANLKFDELYSNNWSKVLGDIEDIPISRP